jgi:tetratricopeptide (TPR) repeat protein
MEKELAEIRTLEGPGGGLSAWGEAARRIVLAEKGDKSQILATRKQLDEARARRPRWAPVALLDARMAVLEGDLDRAGEQYVQAVRLGEREPVVIRAAVDGLYRRRRFAEARDLLRECAEQTLTSPELGKRAAELTLMQSGSEAPGRQQALEQARRAVPANSTDPRDYQWLAQMALAAGEPAEAERMLRKALSLSDKSPATWLALLQLLASADLKKAAAALDEARTKLSAEDAPYVLGAGYEMIGLVDKAREQYEALLAQQPSDTDVLQIAADFYSRRGPATKAEASLRRLLDPAVKVNDAVRSAARCQLARLLAGTGSYRRFRDALGLFDGVKEPTRDDELTKAILLATRLETRREGRVLLEKLEKEGPLTPEAQFTLVRLLDADGEVARAQSLVLGLLAADGRNPAIISWHVQSLLRREQTQSAKPWIEALKSIEPDSLRSAALSASVAVKDGRRNEAIAELLGFVKKHPERRINAAIILEEIGAADESEKLLREETHSGRPEGALALAEFLSRHKQLAEALKLCSAAWKTCPPELVAASSLASARAGGANEIDLAVLAQQFATAATGPNESATLLQARAELEELRRRFDEALALYEHALQVKRDYAPALNNRAWLLALKSVPGGEAVELSNRVLSSEGPVANYLDTRAMAFLAAGQPSRAIADMEEAIRQQPAAAYYYHLALAHLKAGDKTAAASALKEARKRGLRPDLLHPLERERCAQLLAEPELN